ncbi:MAG: rRNA pseudouridine synthase [Bacilli bacterium]|jgi:pseudouridine synthase|nr:rRNA pseudouridine synthase [Bacilli bacterium]
MIERLQKIMSERGYCSRRKAEELIQLGQVKVDGKIITELGSQFESDTCVITVGETEIKPKQAGVGFHYIIVNKPLGFITTLSDDQGRKTVDLLVPTAYGRLYPVGRLDINSSGLLIMTDDGEFANLVSHPSSGMEKTYRVTIDGILTPSQRKQLENGVKLDDGMTAPAQVKVISLMEDQSVFEITIHEGKNREVRRMVEALGHNTLSLVRTRIGPLTLGFLPRGAYDDIPLKTVEEMKDTCLYNREHNTYKKDEVAD